MTVLSTPRNELTVAATAPVLGAISTGGSTTFRVWSTKATNVAVVFYASNGHQEWRPLEAKGDGLFEATFGDVRPGERYRFELDGTVVPDPYARWLPGGPDAPAEVWQSTYDFKHPAPALRADQLVIYELHVGTFTPQGTYAAATDKLAHLKDLGVNCVELLPLAASVGDRNWGYDGVAWFAPFAPYGRPEDLQRFVDEAHGHGIAVLLDAVYNHFGPAGNYLSAYSPEYFTADKKTPWGDALDYANPYMRQLGIGSAEHWLRTFRFDGFRLDATHEIYDTSPTHFLEELAGRVHQLRDELGTAHFLFCEDDRNWPGLVKQYHMDGMWADDFHHQTRILLTGERDGYFAAYEPTVSGLANCINRGWTYEGQAWTVGEKRNRGYPADDLAASNLVYTIQNHDQIGNRAVGDRLQAKAGTNGFLAGSALLLFLPMTPLLFQGQEWMSDTPFQYFTDHEGELGKAITKGRTSEFAHFADFAGGDIQVPDPQAEQTFIASKLDWAEPQSGEHARVLDLYKRLIALRKTDPVLAHSSRHDMTARAVGDVLLIERHHSGERRLLLINFGKDAANLAQLDGVSLDKAELLLSTAAVENATLGSKVAAIYRLA